MMHQRSVNSASYNSNSSTNSSYICDLSTTRGNTDETLLRNDADILRALRRRTKTSKSMNSNNQPQYNLQIVSVEKAKTMAPPPGKGFRSIKQMAKRSQARLDREINASNCKRIRRDTNKRLVENLTNNAANYQYLYEMNGVGKSPANADDDYNEPVIIETKNYNNDNIVLEIDVESKMTSHKRSTSRQFELKSSGSIIVVEPTMQDDTSPDASPEVQTPSNPMDDVFKMANKIATEQPKNKQPIPINIAMDEIVENLIKKDSDSGSIEGSHGFNINKQVDKVLSSARKRPAKMPIMKKLPVLVENNETNETNNSSNSLDTLDDSNLDTSVLTHFTPSSSKRSKQTILCTKCGSEIGCLF